MSEDSNHPAVGIDLGTTFSAISYLDVDGKPQTMRNAEGELTTPSAVFFDKSHPVVGAEAVEAGIMEPERLAMFAKRDVGEMAYEKLIRGESLPPEVIQSLVLKKLVGDASTKLGDVTKAVVTVPAFFNEPCRKATQDAGRLIGLEIMDIINEPTAAAITYGVESGFLASDGTSTEKQTILVYDLGGGTFDVTVMQIEGAKYRAIATAGDVYLGGIDWDTRIVDYAAEQFMLEHDSDPRDDAELMQELIKKASQAKHALSQRDDYTIVFNHEGHRFKTSLSREKFEFLTSDLVDRTLLTVEMVLGDAEIGWDDITRIILVGGSTRMPMIQKAVEDASGKPVDRSLSPDEAISHGAAIYAGLLLKQGGDNIEGMSVRNVNSHDLGVLAVESETGRPRRQIMIPRNNQLPAKRAVRFQTHEDDQPNVKIQIVEGGDDSGNNATQIGKCVVDDLPESLPKGTAVDVEFKYSADGRLRVKASLPDIDREVRLNLDRDAGLQPEQFDYWRGRIEEGMSDEAVPAEEELPEPEEPEIEPVIEEIEEEDVLDQLLPDDDEIMPEEPETPQIDFQLDTPEPAKSEAKPKKKLLKKKKPQDDPVPSDPEPEKADDGPSFPDFSSLKTSKKKK